jgi:hypothetical protein
MSKILMSDCTTTSFGNETLGQRDSATINQANILDRSAFQKKLRIHEFIRADAQQFKCCSLPAFRDSCLMQRSLKLCDSGFDPSKL